MVDVIELIKQDIEVAEKYLDTKKFDLINIIGNRILQHLFIINKKELMIYGIVIKEISLDLGQVKAQKLKKDIDTCNVLAKKCLEDIKSSFSAEVAHEKIWNAYYDFENQIRKYILIPEESAVYKDDFDFATEATVNYLNFLTSNKDFLLKRNINPLERTRAEFASVINWHGGKNAVISYLMIRAFEHVYRFALNGKVSDEELAALVNTNIDRFSEAITLIQAKNEAKIIEHANIMIGDLMYDYRKYFMLFGELKGELVEEIPLPSDVSQKIQKIIDKHKGK